MRRIPFDLPTIEDWPDWRDELVWPVSQEETMELCRPVALQLPRAIRAIDDDESARIAEIAAPRVINLALAAIHAAIVLQAARRKGIDVVGHQAEMRFLQGEFQPAEAPPDTELDKSFIIGPAPSLERLRRLTRPRHWTRWYRLPLTVLRPNATAINHNDMLADRALFTGERVS